MSSKGPQLCAWTINRMFLKQNTPSLSLPCCFSSRGRTLCHCCHCVSYTTRLASHTCTSEQERTPLSSLVSLLAQMTKGIECPKKKLESGAKMPRETPRLKSDMARLPFRLDAAFSHSGVRSFC